MAKAIKLASPVRATLLNTVGEAVFVYADARENVLAACRQAEAGGVSRDDIMEFVSLAYLGKALGRKGVTVADIETLRAIAAKPSVNTKLGADVKRTEHEEASWTAARQGKSRALASLGWISKKREARGAVAPVKTNAEKLAERRAPADVRFGPIPKLADLGAGDKFCLGLATWLDAGIKASGKAFRGPVTREMVALIVEIKKNCGA